MIGAGYGTNKDTTEDDDDEADAGSREEKKSEKGLTSVNAWIMETQRQCAYLMATLIEADITSNVADAPVSYLAVANLMLMMVPLMIWYDCIIERECHPSCAWFTIIPSII
jgi:hypothetical protein